MSIESPPTSILRLGTRGSLLARTQSQLVAADLETLHPGLKVELIICKTSGDLIQDRPLHNAGGKGLFTKELEEALLAKSIDFAVHSYKDVPVTMPLVDQSDLIIAAVPKREDPRDALIAPNARTIAELPRTAKVGSGSLRRRCQLLALRPDLDVLPIRGNIDTRIRKLREGEFDAVILAVAGLKRAGLFDEAGMTAIPADQMLPSPAQGALAIQCRRDDQRSRDILAGLDDPDSRQCVDIERSLVQKLNGDCHSPIAALATLAGDRLKLQAVIGAHGGELPVIRAEAQSSRSAANDALEAVIRALEVQGVRKLLEGV